MEDPSSPNYPQGETTASTNATMGNKPIKKKTPLYAAEDISAEESADDGENAPFSPPSMKELESKAKRDLINFLESKHIDPKYADVYQVHIRLQKKRKSISGSSDHSRKSDGPGYSVTYSSPDGSILTSRGDVLAAIQESKKRTSLSQTKHGVLASGAYAQKRSDAYAQAKQNLHDVLTQLPADIDGITVHSFGHLDPRSGFETSVQLYPVGYKCEQVVSCVNFFKGPSEHKVVCEIGELDGYPEFRITVKSNGDTFIASTEAAVWKKFNPANVETDWQPSFFNLQIELLLEGLQGAETCDIYRFHVERGYGSQYFTQDEAAAAKAAYLAKSGREKRNLERQKARNLSKEEMDRLQELENKRQADEKELAKKLAQVEKERKDLEKEELKRLKQEQRAVEQARRDEERAEEARRKEANKSLEKAQREQNKKNDKFRAQFKKEINAELRKNRADANAALLQYFDEEEEIFEQKELSASGVKASVSQASVGSSAGLADFLSSIPDAAVVPTPSDSTAAASAAAVQPGSVKSTWDDVIALTNTLHLFKRHLKIETPIQLEGLVQSIDLAARAPSLRCQSKTKAGPTAAVTEDGAMEVVTTAEDASAAMTKAESKANDDEEEEAEFDVDTGTGGGSTGAAHSTALVTTDSVPPGEVTVESKLAQAEADLDRIQLKMMRQLLRELRDVLDIADPGAAEGGGVSSAAKGKPQDTSGMSKSVAGRLPLNQLTWAELARMAILNHLYQEQGHQRENIQHALRGAKAPHFRLSKNVIRNIRYRIAVQSKLPATVPSSALVVASSDAAVPSCGGCAAGLCSASGVPLQFLGAQVGPENRLACMSAIHSAKGDKKPTAAGIELATLAEYRRRVVYQNNLFVSEKEIIQSLDQMNATVVTDAAVALPHSSYSEVYRRCSRVLSRLINLNAAKNLIWEVDSIDYPDYYTTITRPVMYTGIAAALLHKQYSFPEAAAAGLDEDALVGALFASDLMQVPINCVTFNSEITPVVSQAYKMLHASHRMLNAWVYSAARPALSMLAESFCLLTQEYIMPNDGLKCGKCTGFYCRSALEDVCEGSGSDSAKKIGAEYAPYYVAPTQEIVDQANEEWVCPLCLCEDSQLLQRGLDPTSLAALYGATFSVDEWGPSNRVPWVLNDAHSTVPAYIDDNLPYLSPFVSALRVLGKTNSTDVLPVAPGATHILSPSVTRAAKHAVPTRGAGHALGSTSSSSATTSVATWSFAERVTVLLALAIVFRSSDRSMDFMQSINADCEKLIKISSKPNFREADFMSVVKDLLGDEGVLQCRSLLDGMEGRSDSYLQQIISEGRCVVCNHSTFEEDMAQQAAQRSANEEEGAETKEDEVILCDGCNAEVHLRCLNLTAVPTAEWHCNLCKERIALRESKHSSLTQFEGSSSIEKHRNKTEEEALLNHVIDRRISAVSTTGRLKDKDKEKDKDRSEAQNASSASLSAMEPGPDEDKCVYCGLGELELCSPFVVGQSRAEHEAVLQLAQQKATADDFYPGATGTTALFLNEGKAMTGPSVEFPYLPPARSEKGEAMIQAYREAMGGAPLIAHQLCALQMFQARITRSRHTLRRKNKVVGQRAVTMTGISVLPLGYDDSGREYWKFPVSDDLFVCAEPYSDDVQAEFVAYLETTRRELEDSLRMDINADGTAAAEDQKDRAAKKKAEKKWKRINDLAHVRRIVELLGASPREQTLRTNLINALLLERAAPAAAAAAAAASQTSACASAEATEETEVKVEEGSGADEAKSATSNPNAGTLNSWIDRSRSAGNLERAASSEDVKALAKKPAVDLVPAAMRLVTARGQDILPSYVIQEEAVFEEDADSDAGEGDDEDDAPVNEYFTYNKGRKYYAIALVNKEGTVLKMGGTAKVQGLTVVYQIHREGIAAPLSYAPLSEAWSDHMYYFATVSFKRSGRYTISFITEGENAAAIKPLIYPVVVEARTVRCGIPHALDRLYAVQFLDATGRAVLIGRREMVATIEQTYSEVDAVRAALLMVYLALPSGALVQDLATDNATLSRGNSFALITEPAGWNDVLDQAWRGAVYQATTPVQLMEYALLLEYYVSKQWLAYPQSRLLSALPNPHFALTCATFSSVALRVYCLDKALMYDKVVAAPRERRSAGAFESYAYEEPAKASAQTSTLLAGRSRRPAAAQASARIKTTVNYNEDSADEDNDEGDSASNEGGGGAPLQPQKWNCTECTVSNEARARSCSACGARKPSLSAPPVAADRGSRYASRASGGRDAGRSSSGNRRETSRRAKYASDEEEEDEAEESSEGSDDSDEDGSGSEGEGEDGESDENSDGQQDSEEDSGRNGRSGRNARSGSRGRTSSRHSDQGRTQARKSSRTTASSTKYFEDSEEEDEDEGQDDDSDAGRKRRRDSGGRDSRGGSNKRAREMTDEEYLAEYKRNIPQRVAEFDAEISALASKQQAGDAAADLQMRALTILRQLVSDTRTEPFWVPVDTKAVPSYLHFIKQPMDLGTIHKRILKGHYGSDAEAFGKDVRLVWSNCKTFNLDYSLLSHHASQLSDLFEDLFSKWVLSDARPANPDMNAQR